MHLSVSVMKHLNIFGDIVLLRTSQKPWIDLKNYTDRYNRHYIYMSGVVSLWVWFLSTINNVRNVWRLQLQGIAIEMFKKKSTADNTFWLSVLVGMYGFFQIQIYGFFGSVRDTQWHFNFFVFSLEIECFLNRLILSFIRYGQTTVLHGIWKWFWCIVLIKSMVVRTRLNYAI